MGMESREPGTSSHQMQLFSLMLNLLVQEGPTPVNVFKQIDLNSDMALSRDEISGYLKQQVETMAAAGGEQGEEAKKMMEDQDKLVEEIFAHEDKDKDGLISHEEFSGPKHDEL